MQLAPLPFSGPRLAALVLLVAPFLLIGCGESDECSTNSDCPPGRICRLGLCALDPGGDTGLGDTLPDIPLDCLVAGPDDLIMTEILADPPAGSDPDGNGASSTSGDEFVEVVNIAARPVALTNVEIDVGGKRVGLGAICLNPYQARVLFGSGDLPGLTNSGGTVSLVVDGAVVQSHTYGAEGGRDSSLTLERQLDKTSAWVLHKDIAQAAFSPGTCANGNAFPDCDGGVIPDAEVIGDGEVVPSCTTVPAAGDLVINEILADPGDLDANGDGVPSGTDDEFVEVVNVSSSILNLDGVVFRDAGTKVFNLPPGICLGPNQVLLIFGKYNGTGSFGDAVVLNGNNLSLNNDADTVTLVDSTATVLAQASYSGNLANADQSIVRETDLSGSANFVRHALAPNAGGRRMSPGFCQSGSAFPDCSAIVEPPPSDTDTSDGEVSETVDPTDTTDTVDTVETDIGPSCGPLATAADLVLNEVMARPNNIDWNGDGTADNNDDEFVEIVAKGAGPVRLDGFKVADLQGDRFTFPALCLEPGEAVVVFGKGTKVFTAAGVSQLDSTQHRLQLNDSASAGSSTADQVSLLDPQGQVVLMMAFGTSTAGVSWALVPDVTGTQALHPIVGTMRASPGQCVSGESLPTCLAP
ncbi:MAG TPA: lamin tail domain-containing protein [Myxococcota bacterium]|nr:lamin tail domain-containing protein [Myxococcota bacterium]